MMTDENAADDQVYSGHQAKAYDSDPEHTLFDEESVVWLDEIDKLGLTGNSRILDFGAGTGSLLSALKDHGLDAVGLEPSAQMIEQGLCQRPQLSAEDFVLGSAEDGQLFQDATFELIVSRQVLCHLREPMRVFKGLRGWLKPGGTLMLVDGFWSAQSWRPDQLASLPLAAILSTDPIRALLTDTGFVIAQAGPFHALNAARAAVHGQTRHRYLVLAKA